MIQKFSVRLALSLVLVCVFVKIGHADDDHDDTTDKFDEAIGECLSHWKTHPFKTKNPRYKVLKSTVKVLGIGKDIEDRKPTDKPELVLVKPNVAVLAKSKLKLLNPNGYYCLKGGVSVLGKTEMEINCHAHFASSQDGAEVLGATDNKSGGTSVLGSVRLVRSGKDCPKVN